MKNVQLKSKDDKESSSEREIKLNINNLNAAEKIEAAILGIFKCTGSKNLNELDLVESLEPRSISLSAEELKVLENLGSEDKCMQITRRRSSVKHDKRKEKEFISENIANLISNLNNIDSSNMPYYLQALELSQDITKEMKDELNKKPLFKVTRENSEITNANENTAPNSNITDMLQKQISNTYNNISELNLNINNNNYFIGNPNDHYKQMYEKLNSFKAAEILFPMNSNQNLYNNVIPSSHIQSELSYSNIHYSATTNQPLPYYPFPMMNDFLYDNYILNLAQKHHYQKQSEAVKKSQNCQSFQKEEKEDIKEEKALPILNQRSKNRSNSSFIPITKEELNERKSFHIDESREALEIHTIGTQILINNDDTEMKSASNSKNQEEKEDNKDDSIRLLTNLINNSQLDIKQIENFLIELKVKENRK